MKLMYFLSFETSSKIFSLALNRDEKVLRYRNIKSTLVLEDSILPAVDKMLDAAGITFKQVDSFAIALGPGSFTSLRVGLATIKAFAMATGRPVVGIPTLDIIAYGVYNQPLSFPKYDEICVLNDARRGKVYACLYGAKGSAGIRHKTDYLLTSLEDVLDKVHGTTLFVGDALDLYRKDIEAAYRQEAVKNKSVCKCLFADNKWAHPQAKVMAALGFERLHKKKYDDPSTLLPLYLYPQDCQVTTKHGR